MKKIIILSLLVISFTSCTQNQRARTFGGTETVELQPNEVILNATWKNDEMWLFVEDTVTHTKSFREKSSFGLIEGEVKFK